MATILQQQLAAIAANSTHQLDLKAQKSRHSKSLLFDARDAATQSFDTIFQICSEGFEELCLLDARLSPFARNLFSEQSKDEDRTQMTARENEELNNIVEDFLGLVGGRLLLKPAIQAVEWLVRRFQVQDYNTECLLLTFLPYHAAHIFPTLLSILPEQLPANFRFLHPYVASLQSPPRHAILSATINSHQFFSAFSHYVLKVAKSRHHSAVLLGFWASITAQAVNGQIDSSRSGRDSVRKQREEDLLLRVLPILQSALSIKGIQELYLGACMIMTILATKASLEDRALDAMMEAVAGSWTEQLMEEGLTCLAVIAEEKQTISQPPSVTRAMLKCDDSIAQLIRLGSSQRVSKFAAATIIGISNLVNKKMEVNRLASVRCLLESHILIDEHTFAVLEKLLSDVVELETKASDTSVRDAISSLLGSFSEEHANLLILERVARKVNFDTEKIHIPSSRLAMVPSESETAEENQMEVFAASSAADQVNYSARNLPDLPNQQTSFLDPTSNDVFKSYADLFQRYAEAGQANQFLALPQLHKDRPFDQPELLSFVARAWTSNMTANAKLQALNAACATLDVVKVPDGVDTQALLPYMLAALADSHAKVRKGAAELCRKMHQLYEIKTEKDCRKCPSTNIYGASGEEKHWLSSKDAHAFLSRAILPILEDCILDANYLTSALPDILDYGSRSANFSVGGQDNGDIRKALRSTACEFLAMQAVCTPALGVKIMLLRILNKTSKHGTLARSTILPALVRDWVRKTGEDVALICAREGLHLSDADKTIFACVTHRSDAGMKLLRHIAAGEYPNRPELISIAFDRLKHLVPLLKAESMSVVDFMIKSALDASTVDVAQASQEYALGTLRSMSFQTDTLVHLVESLPAAADIRDQPPSAKKQRTGRSGLSNHRALDQGKLAAAIRHITLVLELVEGSKPAQHPQLLKGLFHLLGELHHFKALSGSELVYMQSTLLSCLLSVVEGLRDANDAEIDKSIIRTDLIVECVRTSSSTQVHNTALLLVSSLASWSPELVLHSVMPLFTFMSSTLLRQGDDFSNHVTDQTVAKVVPALAASLKKKGRDLVTGASELLLSFTAAFEHIPLHRRLGLFEHLVQTLGPDEALYAVLAMLSDRYPSDSNVPDFISTLTNRFQPRTALLAAKQYIDLVFDCLKPKRKFADVLLGLNDKDDDDIEQSIDTLLEGLSYLMQNPLLRKRLATNLSQSDEDASDIKSLYVSLLEHSMLLTQELASNSTLKDGADTILYSILGLMPTKDFIESSAQLMQTGSDQTRQQVFRSLENRVVQAKRGNSTAQAVFIDVLPNCGVFVREDQPIATRLAAVSCIDQISEKFGKTERSAVLEVAEHVSSNAALGSDDDSLRVISILCLASMVEVLGDEGVSIMPSVLAKSLGYVAQFKDASIGDERLVPAVFALLNAILDHLPWMLSSQHLDQALELSFLPNESRSRAREGDAVSDFRRLVAKRIDAGDLFAALKRTWVTTYASHKNMTAESVKNHLDIFHLAVEYHNKATITKNSPALFTLLLETFDLRRLRTVFKAGSEIDQTALLLSVDSIALDVVFKLNDATFRPFFDRFVQWTTTGLPERDDDGRKLRMLSLYSFSLRLFQQLSSIVTSYANFLLDNIQDILRRPLAPGHIEQQLRELVLQTLSASFSNDQDDFWQSPAHFDVIAPPLIDQLANAKFYSTSESLTTTIAELAAAASSSEHHKTMNAKIMSYMRDSDATVRLAAVKCERAITDKVNFDWLALLPEMLPFISELQEDDDENVERETLRWVKQIEDVTGESLEGMLA